MITIDEAISNLEAIRKNSAFGGQTCVYACIPDMEFVEVSHIKMDGDGRESATALIILKDVHPQNADELVAALKRLEKAARERESTMGDPCRLLEVQAELEAAAEHARAVISKRKE